MKREFDEFPRMKSPKQEAWLVIRDQRAGDRWFELHMSQGCLAAQRDGESLSQFVARVSGEYAFELVPSRDVNAERIEAILMGGG